GMAYAEKYRKSSRIVVTYCGDGATSSNDFHTACNFAGVWKVPVVFFVNNNQWAITVPLKKQTASESIAIKARAYGFEGIRVDGNNIFEVLEKAKYAIDKARSGGGPTLIECVTYRMGPHSTSDDPRRYIPSDELEKWKKKDPIEFLKQHLISKKILTEDMEKAMREEIILKINSAVEKAQNAPPPPIETLITDVYENIPPRLEKELAEIIKE
ncbi:MAG: thiamine pyrophosphate-dependent dehydrogenase E1 component subunit alpha, partial [Planctomycetota bacterium]